MFLTFLVNFIPLFLGPETYKPKNIIYYETNL